MIKHSCACCAKLLPQILKETLGAHGQHCRQPSKTLAVMTASCYCAYGQMGSIHSLEIFRMFQRGARCIEILHSNIYDMSYSPKLVMETLKLGARGQATATLKDFGHSDCFLQLRIWSAGPHSFLATVNIQNVSIWGARCIEMLHSNIHVHAVPNCSRHF